MRTDSVRAKVNPEIKLGAQAVLDELGLSMSEAINLLLVQINLQRSLPFEIRLPNIPNNDTAKVLKDTDMDKGIIQCKDEDDFFGDIGI